MSSSGGLYTCDLICRGVASPEVFQSYCCSLEARAGKKLSGYAHRGSGIAGKGGEIARYSDGTTEQSTVATRVWSRLWHKHLCRESCHRCGYHSTQRPGDVTIGDWWGLKWFLPGLEDAWGVSCIIASTKRGLSLLRGASSSLDLTPTPVSDVVNPAQPMLAHPAKRQDRNDFWPGLYARGFEAACRSVGALGSIRAAKDFAKKVVSTLSGGSAKSPDASSVNRAWREAPVVDFEELVEGVDYPVAFAARNRDDEVRRQSSSGGMYHALATHVIGDLDGVVYGCAFDDGLRAVHIRCETMTDAERCMGSKYSQSDMGDSIRLVHEDLEAGRTVLFTGTPCQVAAVRAACADIAKKKGGAS